MATHLKLIGTDGLSKGEEFLIKKGDMVLIGRSRNCTICLADLKKYEELDPRDEVAQTKFRTVDGKHLKIYFKDLEQVIVEDLSKNGTYLEGQRVSGQVQIRDIEETPQTLLLGLEERFRLEVFTEAEPAPELSSQETQDLPVQVVPVSPKTTQMEVQGREESGDELEPLEEIEEKREAELEG